MLGELRRSIHIVESEVFTLSELAEVDLAENRSRVIILMGLLAAILTISLVHFVKLNKAYRLLGPEVHQDEGTGDTSEG